MNIIESNDVIHIIQKTLSLIDTRLVDHGTRVAYILYKILKCSRRYDDQQIMEICLLGILHDIGAYKTDEIDQIVQFETKDSQHHAIYGYTFIKNLTPLSDLADAILYHHFSADECAHVTSNNLWIANLIHLADRVDVYLQFEHGLVDETFFSGYRKNQFFERDIDLFLRADKQYGIVRNIMDGTYEADFFNFMKDLKFSESDIDCLLRMPAYLIDFRSEFTVTHTISTAKISLVLADMLGLSEERKSKIYYGACLHDIGKVSTPTAILEYPGKLSFDEMEIMKQHVTVTEDILNGHIDPEVCNIAAHHHEKLNGSGYPKGLSADQLSEEERIVAIADILSALNGKRSYKEPFPKEKIVAILTDMSNSNQLDRDIVMQIVSQYDTVIRDADIASRHALDVYHNMKKEYMQLSGSMEAKI